MAKSWTGWSVSRMNNTAASGRLAASNGNRASGKRMDFHLPPICQFIQPTGSHVLGGGGNRESAIAPLRLELNLYCDVTPVME